MKDEICKHCGKKKYDEIHEPRYYADGNVEIDCIFEPLENHTQREQTDGWTSQKSIQRLVPSETLADKIRLINHKQEGNTLEFSSFEVNIEDIKTALKQFEDKFRISYNKGEIKYNQLKLFQKWKEEIFGDLAK